jgi:hypothetical protein
VFIILGLATVDKVPTIFLLCMTRLKDPHFSCQNAVGFSCMYTSLAGPLDLGRAEDLLIRAAYAATTVMMKSCLHSLVFNQKQVGG